MRSRMSAEAIAKRLNQLFKKGDEFATSYYGWAGTP